MLLCLLPTFCFAQINSADYPVYNGKDLGVNYTAKKTVFKVWAPKAAEVKLRLYAAGIGGKAINTIAMNQQEQGVWQVQVDKDIKNTYYTFQILQEGNWLLESPDIYAKAVGVNGKRGMVINMAETNPSNWKNDKKPALKNATDIILYESHVRDISISKNSGIQYKGKYLGIAETGTKSTDGVSTGLDHLKELGITH